VIFESELRENELASERGGRGCIAARCARSVDAGSVSTPADLALRNVRSFGKGASERAGKCNVRWRLRYQVTLAESTVVIIVSEGRSHSSTLGESHTCAAASVFQLRTDQSKICPSRVPMAMTYADLSSVESENATSNGTPFRTRYRQSIKTGCRASFPIEAPRRPAQGHR
jgi:hypothetical protein